MMTLTKDIWFNFVQTNSPKKLDIPSHILESWQYCHENQVNPYSEKGFEKISIPKLNNLRHELSYVIDLVKFEIKQFSEFFHHHQPLFILTDKLGIVIWRTGNHETTDLANQIRFLDGSIWTEKAVGTNAIGITLRTKESAVVRKYEHYAQASHPFVCQSVPINDAEGELIGCLNISTPQEQIDSQMTVMALQMIAKSVHEKLKQQQRRQLVDDLLDLLPTTYQQGIICNKDQKIVSLSSDWSLRLDDWYLKSIAHFKAQCLDELIRTPLTREQKIVGYFYQIKPKTRVQEIDYVSFGIPSKNAAYQDFLNQLLRTATSQLPIHIFGETGSGKEVSAKTIHYNSPVKKQSLVAVNCGALSENLLESELFGYAPGAFTGANQEGYIGKIRQADQGTLFLDEVDSMSPRMQVSLLRVLEDKQVTPLGGTESYTVNFRLITASNKDLKKLVTEGSFREDLFYRLYVFPLSLPPLRQRLEDMDGLIDYFCKEHNWFPNWLGIVRQEVKKNHWPGNIREFLNFLERLYLFYPDNAPTVTDIQKLIQSGSVNYCHKVEVKKELLTEKEQIEQALLKTNFHMTETAKTLGMARSTLYRKLDKYQIVIKK
ncbi:hypothetical protein CBF34_04845 [Vagococcus penaei]|nr:sigma-54-dependent Fis family transcriptional regulator [Vagococcus penaei]RSU04120.1 hypothetical protein CBF34_04845 [Vagococcus penaei]